MSEATPTSSASVITVVRREVSAGPSQSSPLGPPPNPLPPQSQGSQSAYYPHQSPSFAEPPPYGGYAGPPVAWQAPPNAYQAPLAPPNGYQASTALPTGYQAPPHGYLVPAAHYPMSPLQVAAPSSPYSQVPMQLMQHSPYPASATPYHSQQPQMLNHSPYQAAPSPHNQPQHQLQQHSMYHAPQAAMYYSQQSMPQQHHQYQSSFGQSGGYYREEIRTPTPPDPSRNQGHPAYQLQPASYQQQTVYQQQAGYQQYPADFRFKQAQVSHAAEQRQYEVHRDSRETPVFESERNSEFTKEEWKQYDGPTDFGQKRYYEEGSQQRNAPYENKAEMFEEAIKKKPLIPVQPMRQDPTKPVFRSIEEMKQWEAERGRREERREETCEWNWVKPPSSDSECSIKKWKNEAMKQFKAEEKRKNERRGEGKWDSEKEEPTGSEPVPSTEKEKVYVNPRISAFEGRDEVRLQGYRSPADIFRERRLEEEDRRRARRGSSRTPEEEEQMMYRLSLLDRTMQAVYSSPEDARSPERRRTESRQYEDSPDLQSQRGGPTSSSTRPTARRSDEKMQYEGRVDEQTPRRRFPSPLPYEARRYQRGVYASPSEECDYSDLGAPTSSPRLKAMVDSIVKERSPGGGKAESKAANYPPPHTSPVRRRAEKIHVKGQSLPVSPPLYYLPDSIRAMEKRQYDHVHMQIPQLGRSVSSLHTPLKEKEKMPNDHVEMQTPLCRPSVSSLRTSMKEREKNVEQRFNGQSRLSYSSLKSSEREKREKELDFWNARFTDMRYHRFNGQRDRDRVGPRPPPKGEVNMWRKYASGYAQAQQDSSSPSSSPTLSMHDQRRGKECLPPAGRPSMRQQQVKEQKTERKPMVQRTPRGNWNKEETTKKDEDPPSRSSSPTLSMIEFEEEEPRPHPHRPSARALEARAREMKVHDEREPVQPVPPSAAFTPVVLHLCEKERSPSPDYWQLIDEFDTNARNWLRMNVMLIIKSHWLDVVDEHKKLVTIREVSRILRSYDKCAVQRTGQAYDDVIGSIFGYKDITWIDFLREMRDDKLITIHEVKGIKKEYALFAPSSDVSKVSEVHKKPFTD